MLYLAHSGSPTKIDNSKQICLVHPLPHILISILIARDMVKSDGVFGSTVIVAGIVTAVGVAVLVPLLIFILKSLCRAAKTAPGPDG